MNRSIRVLVADDEKNLRDLVVRELSRRGLEVEGVGDGEAALDRLRENPYDVVVHVLEIRPRVWRNQFRRAAR